MTFRQIWEQWDKFWFSPQSPAPVCLFRIAFGLCVLANALLLAPDLLNWYGQHAICSINTIGEYEQHREHFSFFFEMPCTDETAITLFSAMIIASITLTVGLLTRTSAAALFLLLVSFHHRQTAMIHSGDTVLRLGCFFLMFSSAGEMFSVDRLIKKFRGIAPQDPWKITVSPWPMRLLQLQMCAIYCQTFWSKMGGQTWLNGTAIYYVSKLEEFARFPVPFLYNHMWTINLMTWGAIFIEFALWTLVWIRDIRYYVLLAGVALHLGIDYSMNIPVFEYTMIALYINFIDPADIKRALDTLQTKLKLKQLSPVSQTSKGPPVAGAIADRPVSDASKIQPEEESIRKKKKRKTGNNK